jgi:hypothetical protein
MRSEVHPYKFRLSRIGILSGIGHWIQTRFIVENEGERV